MKTQSWIIAGLCITLALLVWKIQSMDQTRSISAENEQPAVPPERDAPPVLSETNQLDASPLSEPGDHALDAIYGHWTPPEEEKYVANPGGPLDEGFEWTDEYYDPDRIDEPGYRDMVISAIYAKHYYESPERKLPPFQQSAALLERWNIEPTMDHTVLIHDAAHEWHMHQAFADQDSGPAAGPDGKKMAAFKMYFHRENITSRLNHFLGIKDKAFFEELIEIKPESGILKPLLIINPGDRLMRQTD
jgi:hypothetical protein